MSSGEENRPPKTVRQRLAEALENGPVTALELSQMVRISEREVLFHLPHVARSVSRSRAFTVRPPRCLDCGFAFAKRQRFSIPGRCPICRSERISPPVFSLE